MVPVILETVTEQELLCGGKARKIGLRVQKGIYKGIAYKACDDEEGQENETPNLDVLSTGSLLRRGLIERGSILRPGGYCSISNTAWSGPVIA